MGKWGRSHWCGQQRLQKRIHDHELNISKLRKKKKNSLVERPASGRKMEKMGIRLQLLLLVRTGAIAGGIFVEDGGKPAALLWLCH